MRLLEAFYNGRRVPFTAWNTITNPNYRLTAPTWTEQRYNDTRAEVLAAILAHCPRPEDMKLQMETVQQITDSVMDVITKGDSRG